MKNQATHQWLAAASVFTGAVMAALDTFMLYVATPHLRGVFSATTPEVSWISTSYAVATLVCMLMSGWLCKRFGRKNVYQYGLLLFIGSSAVCGLSNSLAALIVARIFQGAAAGIIIPVENMILRQTFSAREIGKVMSIYGASIMAGPALGPWLGGYIIENHNWSWIFYVNVPIGLFGLVLATRYIAADPPTTREDLPSYDWAGFTLLISGVFCLIWLLERGDRLYWFSTTSNVALLWVSVFSLAMFAAHELSIENPMIDLRVLKFKMFSLVTVMNFFIYFIVTGTLFILPIYMQGLLGFSASKAGAVMAPRALCMILAFFLVGYLFNRISPKILVCSGLLVGIYTSILMVNFTHETGVEHMYLPLILQGISVVLVFMPLTTLGPMFVDKGKMGSAVALDATLRQLGGSLGIAAFASLLTHFELSTWGVIRHSVSLSFPLFFERFGNVIYFFQEKGYDPATAMQKAARLLSWRTEIQVSALTYQNIFQGIALCFVILLFIAMFSNLSRPKESH